MKYSFLLFAFLLGCFRSFCAPGPCAYHKQTIQQLPEEGTKMIRIKKYDRKIIRRIRKNSDLEKKAQPEKLRAVVGKLPFVTDLMFGDCYEVLTIYPGYIYLAVKMKIKDTLVERCYYMRTAKLRFIGLRMGKHFSFGKYVELNKHKLDYKSCGYSPGYIEAARKYCEERKAG